MTKTKLATTLGRDLAMAYVSEEQAIIVINRFAKSLFWKYKETEDGYVICDPPLHPATKEAKERWISAAMREYDGTTSSNEIYLNYVIENDGDPKRFKKHMNKDYSKRIT